MLQKLAALCALVGVGNELILVGGVSWSTLVVALGYPVYFILRRRLGTDHLGGLWCELTLMLPVAALFALGGSEPLAALTAKPLLYLQIRCWALSARWRWCAISWPAACSPSAYLAC